MKYLIILFQLMMVGTIFGQNEEYSGIYTLGTTPDNGRTGIIYVYPNSDTTLLFYLELYKGAPSYNCGSIVGQMNMYYPREADFTMVKKNDFINCSMNFSFTIDSLFIRANNQADDCGYGHGVYSHGDFKRIDNKKPEYFIDRDGDKIWFKDLDWKNCWDWD